MSEQEYFGILDQVKEKIAGGMLEEAEEILGKLYEYKPVKLSWYVADAELKLKKGCGWPEVLKDLKQANAYFGHDSHGMRDYQEFAALTEPYYGAGHCRKLRYLYDLLCGKDVSFYQEKLNEAIFSYERSRQAGELISLSGQLHVMDEMAMYLLVRIYMARKGWMSEDATRWYNQGQNYGYLELKIDFQKENTFIIVGGEAGGSLFWIAAEILAELGHTVYFIEDVANGTEEDEIPGNAGQEIDWLQSLDDSLNHMRKIEAISVIPATIYMQEGIGKKDNKDDLIDFICRELTDKDNAVVVSSGLQLDELAKRKNLKKRMGRLTEVMQNLPFLQHQLQFAWAGSYLSYISDIYDYDVLDGMKEPSKCDFSIVIPARNSAGTLEYTLRTCLEQSYQGTYEIIVSDNSVNGKTEVYELCQDLADERIRYVKTPQDLYLSKSFEYAFLQARGEFILSIGSDDGLLPWALEVLADVRRRYPEEPIIQWYRGFYAWPGFNGGQENMFVIPCRIKKEKYKPFFRSREKYWEELRKSPSGVYILPNLYINSGFKRDYMWTLFQKTGRLWDGWNQDVYMGILNTCINERILNIDETLAIAGMSTGSMGYLNLLNRSEKENKTAEQNWQMMFRWGNMGNYSYTEKERQLPILSNDDLTMANAVRRAEYYGLMSEEEADGLLDDKRIFTNTFLGMSLEERRFDSFLQEAAACAKQRGEAFYKWFMEEVYRKYADPVWYDVKAVEEAKKKKPYKEEQDADGGRVTDASAYGVKDIAGAVKLYTEIGE